MEKKITEEQLTKIQDQQKQLNGIFHEIGILETRKHEFLHEISQLNLTVKETKQELEKEYGAININVENGTYIEIAQPTEEVTENV